MNGPQSAQKYLIVSRKFYSLRKLCPSPINAVMQTQWPNAVVLAVLLCAFYYHV